MSAGRREFTQNRVDLKQLRRSRWFWAITLLLLLGILLRWFNLGGKVFWHDEVFTALRVVGYMGPEVEQTLFTGTASTAETLLQYQTFAPDSTFADTLRSLANHPEHPPLYYLLAWGWVKLWGPSVVAFRSLSAVFSVLTLPALVLLTQELFGRHHPAVIIAPLLFACSPVQVLYAQEARPYSLWGLLTVLASWALLRAIRLKTWQTWGLYALIAALLLYTSILSALVAIAHGIYSLCTIPRREWLMLALAAIGAVSLFLPWIVVIAVQMGRLQEVTAWTSGAYPRLAMMKLWGLHFAALFVDPGLPLDHPYSVFVPPCIVLLIGFSLYRNWQCFPHKASIFLLALTLVPTLTIIGGDILRGSIISVHTRYFFPALIGAELSVAGWLGEQYNHKLLFKLWLAGLLTMGFVTSILLVGAPTWWNKVVSYPNKEIAAAIRAFDNPVILAQNDGTTLGNLISLSYELPAPTPFVVTFEPEVPKPPEATTHTVLLFYPSDALRASYRCPAEQLPVPGSLWQVPCD